MKRRALVAPLVGAAVSWPLVAFSQQPDRMKANDPEGSNRIAAFQRGFENWAASKDETSKSTIVGLATTSNACGSMRQNW
jgi:hypothetical protein